jgi:hypothetical protein
VELRCGPFLRLFEKTVWRQYDPFSGGWATNPQFDFVHHESRQRDKSRILSLIDLNFIRDKKDIFFIGNQVPARLFYPDALHMQPLRLESKPSLQPPWI